MLALLSPAKRLDFETPERPAPFTQPRFLDEAAELARRARRLKAEQLRSLMDISEALADKTARRFQSFSPPFDLSNARQAIFAFKGDVYQGFDAESLSDTDLKAAQERIRILSGLYGVLRPLDLMQPYRLEMGTKLATGGAADLYGFWGAKIARALNEALSESGADTVINLASQEYFKAVDRGALKARVITPEFREMRDGQPKMITLYAKQARGRMARFIALERLDEPAQMKDFAWDGYRFRADLSDDDRWLFLRPDSRK